MFCPKCGAPTADGAKFCEKCRFNLASLEQPAGMPNGASAAAPQQQSQPWGQQQQGAQFQQPNQQQWGQPQQAATGQRFQQPYSESFFGTMFSNYKTILTTQYATFNGRLSRTQYWQFQISLIIVVIVATFIGTVISDSLGEVVMVLVLFAHLIPSFGTAVRRLHDRNMSGWWVLIQFVPTVGSIVLVILLLMGGDKWANRYGNVPGPLS